jgi:deoxyribonuclease V
VIVAPEIMKVPRSPHRWQLTPTQAVAVQRRLAGRVVLAPAPLPHRVVGLDCAFTVDRVLAVAVVWDVAGGCVLEVRRASTPLRFPYVPGLLSFREVPALLAVLRRLRTPVDGILCDGQGIAHSRRFGLASHLGVITGLPTVGCAKSRLCGEHEDPGPDRGDRAVLYDQGERIGTVLRTRSGVRPIYVSPGHRMDHATSVRWVLACAGGYRIPEPVRLADREVAAFKRSLQRRARPAISQARSSPAK